MTDIAWWHYRIGAALYKYHFKWWRQRELLRRQILEALKETRKYTDG